MSSTKNFCGPERRRLVIFQRCFVVAMALLFSILMIGCSDTKESESAKPARQAQPNRTAVMETDAGTIKFELLESDAPRTAENFRQLAERGYYNGTVFHRVVSGFMIQGGDPNGDGTDRKSTRLNSSHTVNSYAVFC